MSELAEPKCPECGKSRFSYKIVVSRHTLAQMERDIEVAEKKLKQDKESLKKASPEKQEKLESTISYKTRQLEKQKDRLNDMLENRISNGHGLIFFCLNCGHIIGTGGRAKDPRESGWKSEV